MKLSTIDSNWDLNQIRKLNEITLMTVLFEQDSSCAPIREFNIDSFNTQHPVCVFKWPGPDYIY